MSAATNAAGMPALLLGWDKPVYALMDGAKFADLPALLAKLDIQPRTLFIPPQDAATIRSGPWFAALDARRINNLFRIEGIADAAVFWRGDIPEDAAFRHLRSLLFVKIPRPADAPPDPFAAEDESVLFRHWDPSVIVLVLPVLDPTQRARLFGPLRVMGLQAKSLGGAREAKWREDWPAAPSGRLKISAAQMAAIVNGMVNRSRQAVVDYLRKVAPAQTNQQDELSLLAFIAAAEDSGGSLGLKTERALGQWAYLLLISQGNIAKSREATTYIRDGAGRPDINIDTLLLGIATELGRRGLSG